MALFRLDGTVERSPAVDAWLAAQTGPLGDQACRWFAQLRACGDEVCELMHDGFATACLGDVAFAYVALYARHATVGFFHGTDLPDPAHLLRGTGKRMRHVRLVEGMLPDDRALQALICAAWSDVKRRVEHGGNRP